MDISLKLITANAGKMFILATRKLISDTRSDLFRLA